MEHTNNYQKTEKTMDFVIKCIKQYSEERFLASLYTRNYNLSDIRIAINDVRIALGYVNNELLRLTKFKIEFLEQWATRDNKRFDTAEKMFNRMRSSMAYLRKQYKKSSVIVKGTPTNNPNLKKSAFLTSVLTYGTCARDLFKLECYTDEVQTLYVEQRALFANILGVVNLCYDVVKREKETSADAEECEKRFDRQLKEIIDLMQEYMGNYQSEDGGIIRQMIDLYGKKQFAQTGYHKYELNDMKAYGKYVLAHPEDGLPAQRASVLPLKANDKLNDAALIARHFDEIRPESKTKASGMKIWIFVCWCGCQKESPDKKYYDLLKAHYHGELSDWHNVTVKKNRYKGDFEAELAAFRSEAAALLNKLKNEGKTAI